MLAIGVRAFSSMLTQPSDLASLSIVPHTRITWSSDHPFPATLGWGVRMGASQAAKRGEVV
jgi:hypothetical protein